MCLCAKRESKENWSLYSSIDVTNINSNSRHAINIIESEIKDKRVKLHQHSKKLPDSSCCIDYNQSFMHRLQPKLHQLSKRLHDSSCCTEYDHLLRWGVNACSWVHWVNDEMERNKKDEERKVMCQIVISENDENKALWLLGVNSVCWPSAHKEITYRHNYNLMSKITFSFIHIYINSCLLVYIDLPLSFFLITLTHDS